MASDNDPERRQFLQRIGLAAAGGLAAHTLAACDKSPGQPKPVVTPAPPAPLPAPIPSGAETLLYPVQPGEVGVVAQWFPYGHGLRYGVKTDGTDTTAEIVNWRDSIVGLGTYDDNYGLKHSRCKGVLPAGLIRITEAKAMLDLPHDGEQIYGYTIEGEGLRLTTIVYDPKTPGPLLFASNRIYGLVIRNLHFCTPPEPKAVSDWFRSESGGKRYSFTFENLAFDGTWRGGVRVAAVPGDAHGGDTNSEFKFDRINIGGQGFRDGFLVDSEDESLRSSQFLNYWMSNINTTMTAGTLVRLRRGGHVTITNLDVSGYQPPKETFVIDLPETHASDAAHSLMIRNARFETLSEHARFLRCRWERGNVCIDGYDDIIWRSTTRPTFEIRASNAVAAPDADKLPAGVSASGAQYWFANARFTGVHRFLCRGAIGSDADNVPATIQYQNCEFCGPSDDAASRNIHSFVRFVADADKSLIFRPHVRFRACRIEAVPNHVTDWDMGVQGARASTTAPIKSLRFGTTMDGRLPSGAATAIVLPSGAMVLRVTWILPGGRAPAAGRGYRFELTDGYEAEGRRARLAVFEGDDMNSAASRVDLLAHDTIPWPLPPKFDPVRSATLVLRETRSPGTHPSAQCIVEYI